MERLSGQRILGLDFGDFSLGVAISDELCVTAQGLMVIERDRPKKLRRTLAKLDELISEYNVGSIVLGLPLKLDGSEGDRCRVTREFGEKIERRFSLPVTYFDERFTTVIAEKVMDEEGLSLGRQKKVVDEAAAMLILQGYLDKCNHETSDFSEDR